MHNVILKEGIEVRNDGRINYLMKDGKVQRYKPWLMDIFSFSYDFLMAKSVFPKKLSANMSVHEKKNKEILVNWRDKKIIELGTGSGSICSLIDSSNEYVGVDVSKGLLKRAAKRFGKSGKMHFELFLVSAEDLPFADDTFDMAICNLSFNFFPNAQQVISQIKRILNQKGRFFCSVPVPERNIKRTKIHGNLLSAKDLQDLFEKNGFNFQELPPHNGAIFYFLASKAAE